MWQGCVVLSFLDLCCSFSLSQRYVSQLLEEIVPELGFESTGLNHTQMSVPFLDTENGVPYTV